MSTADADQDVLEFVGELGRRLKSGALSTISAAEELFTKTPRKREKATFDGVFGGFINSEFDAARKASKSDDPFAKDVAAYERLALARAAAAQADGAQKLKGAPSIADSVFDARAYRRLRMSYEVVTKRNVYTGARISIAEHEHHRRATSSPFMRDAKALFRDGTSVLSAKAEACRANMARANETITATGPKRAASMARVLVRG